MALLPIIMEYYECPHHGCHINAKISVSMANFAPWLMLELTFYPLILICEKQSCCTSAFNSAAKVTAIYLFVC